MSSTTFARAGFDELDGSEFGTTLPSGRAFTTKIGKGGTVRVDDEEAIAAFRADPDWQEQGVKTPKGENPDGTPVTEGSSS